MIIEPSTVLQTAIRSTLIADTDLGTLVLPDNIRSGTSRPSDFPSILLANPQTINLGRGAGGQYCTRVFLDLHIWAQEQGAQVAQQIGGMVTALLWDEPETADATIIDYQRPNFSYRNDPDPDKSYSHGVGTIEASILWRL